MFTPPKMLQIKKDKSLIIRCDCTNYDHIVGFDYFYDGFDSAIYISTHLKTHRSFWRRIWQGLKYVFNVNRNNDWDEVCLGIDDAKQMHEILENFIGTKTI